jgi:hypothetical protein
MNLNLHGKSERERALKAHSGVTVVTDVTSELHSFNGFNRFNPVVAVMFGYDANWDDWSWFVIWRKFVCTYMFLFNQ